MACCASPSPRVSRPPEAPLLASPAPEGKLCALTPLVPEKHGVPATFFLIAQFIDESTKPVLDRALKDGCEFVTLSELFKRKGIDPMSPKGSMWKYVE